MAWTYTTYTVADYTITLGLVLTAVLGVFATFFSSKKGQEFVYERVIGVDPARAHESYNDPNFRQQNLGENALGERFQLDARQLLVQLKQRSFLYIGILCCLLGGMTLAITAILMFQGCFLTSVRLLADDDCPEYSVDCFIFGDSAFTPITSNVSFVCKRLGKAEFNVNITGGTAWCYAWIIGSQTTKSVLDQLGVAIALIGFFTTLLAVIVYLGTSKKTVLLSIAMILICSVIIILLLVFKWSFAPLTYAILAEGIVLGIFGIVLYSVLSKPMQKMNHNNNSTPSLLFDKSQPNAMAHPDIAPQIRSEPTRKPPRNVRSASRPAQVAPQ